MDKEKCYIGKRNRSVAIVVRDNKILMERVRYLEREFYTVPGGGIEAGESPEEAAIRELKEECGLDGTIIRSLNIVNKGQGGQEFAFEVNVSEDQEAILGYDPEEDTENPPLKEVLWMSLDEIPERDRAFLWNYGLISVGDFFEEITEWGDRISYPKEHSTFCAAP